MLSRIGRCSRYITALTGTELSGDCSSSIVSAVASSSTSLQSTSCTLYTPAFWQQNYRTYNTTCQQATPLSSSSITYNQYHHTQFKSVPISSPPVVRYMSTSIDTSTPNQNDTNNRGEELYQQAMYALTQASTAKQKHEEKLLKEQFEAMEKQRIKTQQRQLNRKSNNDPRLQRLNDIDAQSAKDDGKRGNINDRAAGVAVVRTIVKQSNAKRDDIIQKKIHVEQSSTIKEANNNEGSEEHYQKLAQEYMEEAAFRYGHPLALVRLGNEALTHSKNSQDDTTKPLFDTKRMSAYINESPVQLLKAMISSIEDQTYNILALQLYQEGGKQGSSDGYYNLGHMLWEGSLYDIKWEDDLYSKEKAMDAFHMAIELDDADAMYFVAVQYLNYDEEDDGDENGNNALLAKCYELYGSEFLSKLNADGLENEWDTFMEKSIQPDEKSTTKTLDSSAQTQQHTDSQMKLLSFSNMYRQYGYALLQYAAFGHEHGPALHHLALLHNQNDNMQTFHRILTKAASTGNPDSLFLQGHCYYTGTDGHDKNIPLALENFLMAAESDHVDAMVSAGAILHQGVVSDDGRTIIIQRDQQRAFELYQQAGELGSIEGWRNVVSCYATGQGVPKCIDTAKYIANTMLKE